MSKFELSQKDKSRAQSGDSSKVGVGNLWPVGTFGMAHT